MRDLLARARARQGLPVDDVLALVLPLVDQVAALHESGRVAPLRGLGALRVVDHRVEIDVSGAGAPTRNAAAVEEAERALGSAALDVRRGADQHRDLGSGTSSRVEDDVDPSGPTRVRTVAGWQRWEHLVGHHDELTDVGSLGELLAALLTGLDLADEDDARALAEHRRNLFVLAPGVHPVVAGVVTAMVEPDRHRRLQDLSDAGTRLRTYRDQPEDFDLDRLLAAAAEQPGGRRAAVLGHLRDRLFDLSRRNPLLHFRATARTINLTQASVPLVLDARSIRPEQLFTWGGPASRRLAEGKAVDVGSLVRWDDAPYAEPALDTVAATARRDRAEFGQDQLRLVVAFLRWHNLREDADTPITSPLVLAAAGLTKKRGVRQSYRLELTAGSEAEVNPVLRHQLRELYGFTLPETIDLTVPDAVDSLRAEIERQARATERGLAITLVDRPRIELIRSRAQTALQSYRRRRPGRRPTIGRRQYAYSYTRPGWQPLGLQIFQDRLERSPLPLSVELGDAPAPRTTMAAAEAGVVETELYTVTAGETNPYAWEVDLCSVTLANFNYRTLSLVRDYDALLAAPRPHAPFDELFSSEAREAPATGGDFPVEDRYLVVPADDSQVAAIAQARARDNFVIQGPPGTGKSQTITNLIADCLARGQRVLFVCQKRAALDVVHARLRSRGLDEVCTLVHDSQQDKKAFVHGLRDTYEAWSSDDVTPLADLEARRHALVADVAAVREEVAGHDAALVASVDGGPRTIDVLDRLVALRSARWGDDLAPALARLLPDPARWRAARPAVDRLTSALARGGEPVALAASPLALVDPAVLGAHRADAQVALAAETVGTDWSRVLAVLRAADPTHSDATPADAHRVAALHAVLDPLARHGRLDALRGRSAVATQLTSSARDQASLVNTAHQTAAAAAGWHLPPTPDAARAALDVAVRKQDAALRFLSGEWRRAKALVEDGYRTPAGAPAATPAAALGLLVAQQDAAAALAVSHADAESTWGSPDLVGLRRDLGELRDLEGDAARWRDLLAGADDGPREALDVLATALGSAAAPTETGVLLPGDVPLETLLDGLARLASPAGQALVRDTAPALLELAGHPEVLAALRVLDAEPDRIEYAVLAGAVQAARAAQPALDRLDGRRLGDLIDRIASIEPALHRANAEVIVARLRDRFAGLVAHSRRSVSGMSEPDRELKRTWTGGRREVEHEFGKVRAYKSIRHLADGDPGAVVAALRPVWLMSPASLSDTLTLTEAFDVVIYDEASQVPVEEAIPALHRARQVIVVGDRMQLPPTRYFRSGAAGTNPAEQDDDADDEAGQLGVVLDADSFLAVSSTRLPSSMLLWHYRSQFEALIRFSNAAFYEGRLATVPDRTPSRPDRAPVRVTTEEPPTTEAVAAVTDAVLDGSVTVVKVADGVYDHRTNAAEATWTAELVRDLLARETGLTLGVVAFSEAQQGEIERALERLCDDDPAFAAAYDAEVSREEDGQGVGLFVKNLENVQGDERDVILMSVCYAAGPGGRMRMNFGPINNSGGEKRLNVIFSRARRHMVLMSSIEPSAITNVYNDGANTLRGFLQYAEAVSRADEAGATAALASWRRTTAAGGETSTIAEQVADGLRARGLEVATSLGRSGFRCDLGVRRPGDESWTTAVLIDHAERVDSGSTEQRRLVQPGVLRAAGWRVEQVLAQEWVERPEAVLDRLSAAATTGSS